MKSTFCVERNKNVKHFSVTAKEEKGSQQYEKQATALKEKIHRWSIEQKDAKLEYSTFFPLKIAELCQNATQDLQ